MYHLYMCVIDHFLMTMTMLLAFILVLLHVDLGLLGEYLVYVHMFLHHMDGILPYLVMPCHKILTCSSDCLIRVTTLLEYIEPLSNLSRDYIVQGFYGCPVPLQQTFK